MINPSHNLNQTFIGAMFTQEVVVTAFLSYKNRYAESMLLQGGE